MNKNSITITIFLLLLILVAISIIVINKSKNDNYTKISMYSEQNSLSSVTNNARKNTCIASYTTNITYSDKNRTHNIITVCEFLNETTIESDEIFSFNKLLGPFNEQQGYVESKGFDSNGKVIKVIGGGICQVSSTLYNAVLMADLEVIERHAHSAPVDYVPEGKDATISYSEVDFKFKNITRDNILIKCLCNGKTVTVELYLI